MKTELVVGFEGLGLRPELVEAVSALGYEEPTPIQRQAIPVLLAGRDVLGQAATGTGKTAAFTLPALQRIVPGACAPFETSVLVLVPTRELAMQVAEAVHSYGKTLGVTVLPVYGGTDIGSQLRRLKRGIDVVVATPGRALDHLRRKSLRLEKVSLVVLDEADEMLALGFAEDLDAILAALPKERQTALFSATLPPRIAALGERHLSKPVRIQSAQEKTVVGGVPRVRQWAYLVTRDQKSAALARVLDIEAPKSAIVFCRTRQEVETLADTLTGLGFGTQALHGGMDQEQRERVLRTFKAGKSQLLIATDVAARGLHIEKLSHVINYDLPTASEPYVHRIGRTGRAGQEGKAISFVEQREQRLLQNIERATKQKIELKPLPNRSDLEAKKRERLRASVHEVLKAQGLEDYRALAESLAAEFAPIDIAAATLKLLEGDKDEAREKVWAQEIRTPLAPKAGQKGRFEGREKGHGAGRKEPHGDGERHKGPPREGHRAPPSKQRGMKPSDCPKVRLFLSLGEAAGIKPGDLVGAIANEAGVPVSKIGSIKIFGRHSTVEVPEELVTRVTVALQKTRIRGRKVTVNRNETY